MPCVYLPGPAPAVTVANTYHPHTSSYIFSLLNLYSTYCAYTVLSYPCLYFILQIHTLCTVCSVHNTHQCLKLQIHSLFCYINAQNIHYLCILHNVGLWYIWFIHIRNSVLYTEILFTSYCKCYFTR